MHGATVKTITTAGRTSQIPRIKEGRPTRLCSYWMKLRNEKILYFETECTVLQCVENWLWKKIQTCSRENMQ
jgi:hypothetical protein